MGLTPGYKQTEAGVIPEEWKVVSVGDLVAEKVIEKPLDGNHGNIHPKSSDYVGHGIPFVMANNIYDGRVDLENCKFITKARADKLQKGFSVSGDVLLTHKGTVGNTAIVDSLATDYIMLTPQVTYYRVKDSSRLSNQFLRHYFDSNPFQTLFSSLAGGGTRAYLGIVRQLALPVVWPSIDEQRAIAGALSDVDALIAALDQLIEKKRDIKQAAMQRLLTGKQRLPGFRGEWEVKSIAEMAGGDENIVDGPFGSNMKTSDYTPHGVPVLQGLNITADRFMWKDIRYVSAKKAKELFRSNARFGDLLTIKIGSVGFSAVIDNLDGHEFAIIPANLLRIRFKGATADTKFAYYALTSTSGKQKLRDLSGNTAQPALGLTGFRKLLFSVPKTVEEQTAIATVLSDMDAEIAALEQKRDKTSALKQGMMQELLTGRTRLPLGEGTPSVA